jgi:hypothetical protein
MTTDRALRYAIFYEGLAENPMATVDQRRMFRRKAAVYRLMAVNDER